MQVSKCLLAVCATTVCAGFLSLHAQDTPAQAAARAALLQSMGEPAAAAPAAPKMQTPPPAPKVPVAPAAPVTPAAPAVAAPSAAPVAMTPQPIDSEAQAKAREALLQAMGEPAMATPPAAAPTPPAVAAAPPVVMAAPPTVAAAPPAPMAAAPAKASKAGMVGQEPGFPPMVAPPPPVSAAQEQQLDALLTLYKANQISPEEYQKQRAAILAEPDKSSH